MDNDQVEHVTGPLAVADAEAVERLARAAEHVDGRPALSEQPLLRLTQDDAPVHHLLVRAEDDLAGYAQLDLGAPGAASVEVVVHPFARRHGVGSTLVAVARDTARAAGADGVRVWAEGGDPAAQGLARRLGLEPVRELVLMSRDLTTGELPTGPVPLPDGVTVRRFVVGQDEGALLRVNARAFDWHPEQGRMSQADLRARQTEPWFDAADILLLEEDGALVAFVWLKLVQGDDAGELYVVAVDPDAQGRGLGNVTTALALRHLADAGLARATLWTEADNVRAVATYGRAGFTTASSRVQLGDAPQA